MVYTQRPVGEKKKYINEALAHIWDRVPLKNVLKNRYWKQTL